MQNIKAYKISWRPCDNAGSIHLALADGSGATIQVDSAQEMSLLVDLLRNESPVCYDDQHGLLYTGFEPVGEGDADADAGAEAAANG